MTQFLFPINLSVLSSLNTTLPPSIDLLLPPSLYPNFDASLNTFSRQLLQVWCSRGRQPMVENRSSSICMHLQFMHLFILSSVHPMQLWVSSYTHASMLRNALQSISINHNAHIYTCFHHHASIYIICAWLPVCHLQSPTDPRWPPWMAYEEPCIFACILYMV